MVAVLGLLLTYTSLGYRDVRILAGIEVLSGLLTIAWSASFMYMEMTEFWSNQV